MESHLLHRPHQQMPPPPAPPPSSLAAPPPPPPGYSLRVKLYAAHAAQSGDRPVRCFRVVTSPARTIREFCQEASRVHAVNYGQPLAIKKCMDDDLFDITQTDVLASLFPNMATIRMVQAAGSTGVRDSVPPGSALRWEPTSNGDVGVTTTNMHGKRPLAHAQAGINKRQRIEPHGGPDVPLPSKERGVPAPLIPRPRSPTSTQVPPRARSLRISETPTPMVQTRLESPVLDAPRDGNGPEHGGDMVPESSDMAPISFAHIAASSAKTTVPVNLCLENSQEDFPSSAPTSAQPVTLIDRASPFDSPRHAEASHRSFHTPSNHANTSVKPNGILSKTPVRTPSAQQLDLTPGSKEREMQRMRDSFGRGEPEPTSRRRVARNVQGRTPSDVVKPVDTPRRSDIADGDHNMSDSARDAPSNTTVHAMAQVAPRDGLIASMRKSIMGDDGSGDNDVVMDMGDRSDAARKKASPLARLAASSREEAPPTTTATATSSTRMSELMDSATAALSTRKRGRPSKQEVLEREKRLRALESASSSNLPLPQPESTHQAPSEALTHGATPSRTKEQIHTAERRKPAKTTLIEPPLVRAASITSRNSASSHVSHGGDEGPAEPMDVTPTAHETPLTRSDNIVADEQATSAGTIIRRTRKPQTPKTPLTEPITTRRMGGVKNSKGVRKGSPVINGLGYEKSKKLNEPVVSSSPKGSVVDGIILPPQNELARQERRASTASFDAAAIPIKPLKGPSRLSAVITKELTPKKPATTTQQIPTASSRRRESQISVVVTGSEASPPVSLKSILKQPSPLPREPVIATPVAFLDNEKAVESDSDQEEEESTRSRTPVIHSDLRSKNSSSVTTKDERSNGTAMNGEKEASPLIDSEDEETSASPSPDNTSESESEEEEEEEEDADTQAQISQQLKQSISNQSPPSSARSSKSLDAAEDRSDDVPDQVVASQRASTHTAKPVPTRAPIAPSFGASLSSLNREKGKQLKSFTSTSKINSSRGNAVPTNQGPLFSSQQRAAAMLKNPDDEVGSASETESESDSESEEDEDRDGDGDDRTAIVRGGSSTGKVNTSTHHVTSSVPSASRAALPAQTPSTPARRTIDNDNAGQPRSSTLKKSVSFHEESDTATRTASRSAATFSAKSAPKSAPKSLSASKSTSASKPTSTLKSTSKAGPAVSSNSHSNSNSDSDSDSDSNSDDLTSDGDATSTSLMASASQRLARTVGGLNSKTTTSGGGERRGGGAAAGGTAVMKTKKTKAG